MSYAIRNDGKGWRAVNGPDDVGEDEIFSETQPAKLPPTKTERIAAVTAQYKSDVAQMQTAWLAASVSGGTGEDSKKASITQYLADLKIQYVADVATIRNS